VRILSTGACGFIASHLNEALTDTGHRVTGVDNLLTGSLDNWRVADSNIFDITERANFYALSNRVEPEVVIHCAASYNDPDKWHRDTQINVEGGINAALVAKHHNAHLIYFQTILPPVSSYAISKIAAEQYMRLSGVDLTVMRLANIYGPRNLSGPIPVFYKRLMSGDPCVVVDTTREMVFIDDLVRGVQQVVTERLTGTFDVCTGRPVEIIELFNGVRDALKMDIRAPIIPPDPDDVQGTVLPERGIPGWEPRVTLGDGIFRTVASYQASGVERTFTHLRIGQKDV